MRNPTTSTLILVLRIPSTDRWAEGVGIQLFLPQLKFIVKKGANEEEIERTMRDFFRSEKKFLFALCMKPHSQLNVK